MTPSLTYAPERGKRDKALRRQSLIDAANAVFAEHGYDAATTREIAERAGCSEGLIHRYFSGKRGLLLAILESRGAQVAEDFQSVLPDQPTLRQEIEQLLLWHLDSMWERRDFMRVAVSQAAIDPEIGRTISDAINTSRAELITAKLLRHQRAGRVRSGIDLNAIAYSITALGFSMGFIYQACFGESRLEARRIMLGAAAALSRGIEPAPPIGRSSP